MSTSCFSIGPVALAFCIFATAANAVPLPSGPSLSVVTIIPPTIPSSPSIAGLLGTPASEGKTQGTESGRTQFASLPWGPNAISHGFWFDERELIRLILALERLEERLEHERRSHDHNPGGSGGSAGSGGSTGQAPAPTPLPAPLLLLGSGLGLIGLVARRRRKQAVVPA